MSLLRRSEMCIALSYHSGERSGGAQCDPKAEISFYVLCTKSENLNAVKDSHFILPNLQVGDQRRPTLTGNHFNGFLRAPFLTIQL